MEQTTQVTATVVARLKTPADIRAAREHVFPSQNSMDWFMRKHHGELVAAKALRKINNRLLVDEVAFDRAIDELGLSALDAA